MAKDVIIACDFSSKEQTLSFLDKFTGRKPFVKIGMELFYAEGPAIVREIKARGGRIIVTSDCHYPDRLVCWFDEAEEYLSSIGFVKNPLADLNKNVGGIEIWE